METIYFGKSLSATADVDVVGKYVEFRKYNDKIRLYEEEWSSLCNNVHTISQQFLFHTNLDLKFSPVKGLSVMRLRSTSDAILYHSLVFGELEIKFDADDWNQFVNVIEHVKKNFNKDIVYKNHGNSWHLIKEATNSFGRQYNLLSRMNDVEIARWLYAYLICIEVEKVYDTYVGPQCIHKKEKFCAPCWEHIVKNAFHVIKENVSLENGLKALNEAMKWDVKLTEMEKIETHAFFYLKDFQYSWDECDCGNIEAFQGQIYLRLFKYLKL